VSRRARAAREGENSLTCSRGMARRSLSPEDAGKALRNVQGRGTELSFKSATGCAVCEYKEAQCGAIFEFFATVQV
jgi:hypothetical protein